MSKSIDELFTSWLNKGQSDQTFPLFVGALEAEYDEHESVNKERMLELLDFAVSHK